MSGGMAEYTDAHDGCMALDIETAPDPEAVERLLAAAPIFTAPANYRDEAKIEAYVESKAAAWRAETKSKAGLSALTGRVVSWATCDGGEPYAETAGGHIDEAGLLRGLVESTYQARRVATFNGHGFDLPFIFSRLLRHRIMPPPWLLQGMRRYTDRPHCDVRMVLTQWDMRGRGTMAVWYRHLFGEDAPATEHPETGLPIDGADVAGLVEAGEWDALAEYNAADAAATWAMYARLRELGACS